MMYVSIINLTYSNLYLMRRKYYIFLTIACLKVLCTNIIINIYTKPALCTSYYILCCGENELNSIKSIYIFLVEFN